AFPDAVAFGTNLLDGSPDEFHPVLVEICETSEFFCASEDHDFLGLTDLVQHSRNDGQGKLRSLDGTRVLLPDVTLTAVAVRVVPLAGWQIQLIAVFGILRSRDDDVHQ